MSLKYEPASADLLLRDDGVRRLYRRSGQIFFFFTLVTGPRRSLSLQLSDTRVYEPRTRARLRYTATRRRRQTARPSAPRSRPNANTSTRSFFLIFIVQRFRGGLVFKAHRLLCHSTLGWRVITKKKRSSRQTAGLPHEDRGRVPTFPRGPSSSLLH